MARPNRKPEKQELPDAAGANGPDRPRGFSAVYEDMRQDILSLKFAPGSALDEVTLAQRFGLSRTPVREALLMLAGDGLVTLLRGRGAIVTPHTMSNAHQYLDTLILLSRAVSRLSATAHDNMGLMKIRAAQMAYEQAVKGSDILAIAYADLDFHRAVSLTCGNEFLGKYYRNALDAGRRMYLLHYYPVFGDADRQISVQSHADLVAAIEAANADRAEAIASEHVISEVRAIQRSLEPKMGSQFALNTGSISQE